jgi:hypothetical protein
VTQPSPEDKAKAGKALSQLLRVSGMDPDEAADLAGYAVEQAAQGKTGT